MLIRTILAVCIALFTSTSLYSQTVQSQPGPRTICPPGPFTGHHYTPVPEAIANKILMKFGEDACATIEVTYNGFTPAAQAAFQEAVDIWSYSISSPVTIRVNATWEPLDEGVLGAAGPANVFRNFNNAPDANYYASALADEIAGTDLDPGNPDIEASFSSVFDWYLGTDGNVPNDKFDLVSVVLHELGHGLGFISSANYDGSNGHGTYGLGSADIPLRFDPYMILGQNGTTMLSLAEGSVLGDAFTSNNVYCNSVQATTANGNVQPQFYAPGSYEPGSSLSHWNEISYPAGDPQSLMTPQIGPGEAIHSPGSVTLGLFEDMGWTLCDNTSPDEACTTWDDPNPTDGWNNFNLIFGGAPCDDGTGCPFNEIQDFEVVASEAYAVDSFQEGGTYTFSICNGPGAGSWSPDFTIIAPSGNVDAYGPGDGCSITWTASESGTYLIVINEANHCGDANTINNGYPALTCVDGTTSCGGETCATGDLINYGESTLCPDETTTVNMDNPATVPDGGGFGISFVNTDTQDGINLTGVSLPYTFNNDLNGLLSSNGYDPFEGEYELIAFVYTDASDATGSVCAIAENSIVVTFLAADDPVCTVSEDCETESLIVLGDASVCPDNTTSVDLVNEATIPVGGGYGIIFSGPTLTTDLSVTGITLPYTFDNDLNGLLSQNGYNLFDGEYELTGFVYTDADDIPGSVCSTSPASVTIEFLASDDPACSDEEPCETGTLVVNGETAICPENTTTVGLNDPASIPDGGGFAIDFYNPTLDDGITLTGVTLPYTFDNDLNGVLSANGYDLFEGEYELTGIVYSDVNDFSGSVCALSPADVTINFLASDDSICSDDEPCMIGTLIVTGESAICPENTTTVILDDPATIPDGGGFGILFSSPTLTDDIPLTGVTLPYTFDNDLNGLLSQNGYDLFEGEFELTGFVYSNSQNAMGSICATSTGTATVNFLSANDPDCISGIDETGANFDWVVYPNPASSYVFVKMNSAFSGNCTIEIRDISGRIVQKELYNGLSKNGVVRISTVNMAGGFYSITIENEKGRFVKNIVVD